MKKYTNGVKMDINKEINSFFDKHKDSKYLKFSNSLDKYNNYNRIGIRVPILREYTKELCKKYSFDYLYKNINEDYYEQIMMKGFIIHNNKKLDYEELSSYIKDYVPKIKDWSICDTFCAGLKITRKYLKETFKLLKKYLKSKKEFEVRFALVMLLNYYLIDDYIDEVLSIINNIKLEDYYVKMASSWLISFCLIKYYDKTYNFFKNNNSIDSWVFNKGIQKSIESYRISKEKKEELKELKKKNDLI